MDDLSTIDIEGKTLALTGKELKKLTGPEGCQLQVVTNRVFELDENNDDVEEYDNEDANFSDYQSSELDKKSKEERMKREYISLILNANNDPIKPGTKFKPREFSHSTAEHDFELSNLDDKYHGVHKLFESMGNYDEYMKKNSFTEVTPGQVYKMIRVSGLGKHTQVTENSLVIYNCALWTEGAKDPFDSTWLRRTTTMTNMATDSLLPGFREILLTTQQHELCESFIKPESAFGRLGAMPRIPPNATIFCLLEVVRVVPKHQIDKLLEGTTEAATTDNPVSALKFDDFYEASDEARRRGNYFYEQEQYKIALQRYKSAISLLEGYTYQDEHEEAKAKGLLVRLFNNCARTSNAMGNPRGALAACKQASIVDDRVPKTYWHRMSAWAKKGHYDNALGVARRAIDLFHDPTVSKPFIKAAEEYKFKLQQEQAEVDKLHKLMGRALVSST